MVLGLPGRGQTRPRVKAGEAYACLPVKVDVPVVLGGQRPHSLEEIAFSIVALLGGRAGLGTLTLRQAGQAPREELWSHRHCELAAAGKRWSSVSCGAGCSSQWSVVTVVVEGHKRWHGTMGRRGSGRTQPPVIDKGQTGWRLIVRGSARTETRWRGPRGSQEGGGSLMEYISNTFRLPADDDAQDARYSQVPNAEARNRGPAAPKTTSEARQEA